MVTGIRKTRNGNEIVIRPLRPDDAADLHEAERHPEVAHPLLLTPFVELKETLSFVEGSRPNRHFLVAEMNDRAVGSAILVQKTRARIMHSGTLGLMVHHNHWGEGIGSLLMEAILEVADRWLDLRRVELGVLSENRAAISLYEKHGFSVEGRRRRYVYGDGRWLDDFVMARLRGSAAEDNASEEPAQDEDAGGTEEQSRPQAGAGQVGPQAREAVTWDADHLTVRPPRPDDVEALYAIYSHPSVARTTLQMPTQEIGRTEERLHEPQTGLFRFVADYDGRAIGALTLNQEKNPRRRHAASLGMAVHPGFWGLGVGSELMAAAVDLADNWINLQRIELDVNVDNKAGIRLYHKFGFTIEGTRRRHVLRDGQLVDNHFMARLRD